MTNLTQVSQTFNLIEQIKLLEFIKAAVILIAGFFIAKSTAKLTKKVADFYLNQHQSQVSQQIIFYVIFALFILSALEHLGFSLNIFLGATGIVTLAAGFAAQTSVANLISGLFLIMEKPFKIGETISIDTITGQVQAIDLLSIKLCTSDNQYVRIPNETLIKTTIINLSRCQLRRVDLNILVDYSVNLETIKITLLALIKGLPHYLNEPAESINLLNFAEFGITLQLCVWTEQEHYSTLKNALAFEIQKLYQTHILIPPQVNRLIDLKKTV